MRKIKRKSRHLVFYFAFIIFAGVSIGYAVLTTSLNILGKSTLNRNSWNIYFDNVKILNNYTADLTSSPQLDEIKTKIIFNLKLSEPGQFYEISTDVVNKGTIDAMFEELSTNLTTEQQKYLDYSVNYIDDVDIKKGDYLKQSSSESIKIKISFKKDITAANLQTTTNSISIMINLKYLQADNTAHARTKASIVCKRATNLETATCTRTDYGCYSAGYYSGGSKNTSTITYGHIGTKGVLTSGDAFDCDVQGNSTTTRFYYLTDLDSNTAILLSSKFSYKKTPEVISSGPDVHYDSRYIPDFKTANGPLTARTVLPTSAEWTNTKLQKPIRTIQTNDNSIVFNYSEYAARLPSKDEIAKCGANLRDDNCTFLYQNTAYENPNYPANEIMTETPFSLYFASTYNATNRQFQAAPIGAIKAVIEVPKTRISY